MSEDTCYQYVSIPFFLQLFLYITLSFIIISKKTQSITDSSSKIDNLSVDKNILTSPAKPSTVESINTLLISSKLAETFMKNREDLFEQHKKEC